MNFSKQSDIYFLWIGTTHIQACRFRRKAQKYRLASCAAQKCGSGEDPSDIMKNVLKQISWRSDSCLVIGASLETGLFFQSDSVALSQKEQRSALEFELPNHLFGTTEQHIMQFSRSQQGENEVKLNVYAFDRTKFGRIAEMLTRHHIKADEFVYPLLALHKGDPALYVSEIDPDFYFDKEAWISVQKENPPDFAPWKQIFTKIVQAGKNDFDWQFYAPCLLMARFVLSGEMDAYSGGVRIMPQKLRPSRYRFHLCICILLCVLLCGFYGWRFLDGCIRRYKEYKAVVSELKSVKNKTKTLAQGLKRAEKEQKELVRIVGLSAGTRNMLIPLSRLSRMLPSDAWVMNVRYNEDSIDMNLQTAAESFNLPQGQLAEAGWKIGQIQQRRMENISFVNLRLIPAKGNKK